ncbi:MAG: phosphotransferase family protein [Anaerolineae bacterium]
MAESFPVELLRTLVASKQPVDPAVLTFQPILTGKHNTSYFVGTGDGELVLRIAPPDDAGFLFYERRMMAQEPEIHALLRERTTVPVARILAYDDSRTLIDRDYLLMQRLPGRPLTEVQATESFYNRVLFQVGGYLREMYALTAETYGYLGAHHPMEPQASWWEAFVVMWNLILDDIVAAGGYTAEEAAFMRQLLRAYRSCFNRSVPASLLHMDVWHQNILVDAQGTVTGLVDLDRALWGDPEIEFAVLDYCGISEPAFCEGYGQSRDASPEARIRTRFYLLYEVQKYIVIRLLRRNDPAGAQRYKQQSFALARPLAEGLSQG